MRILATLIFLIAPLQAIACGCSSPNTIEDLRYPSIVFDGEVLWIKKIPRSGGFVSEGNGLIGDFSSQEITFKLLRQYQGPEMSRITVSFNERGSTSCDLQALSFKVGETYLISTLLPPPAKKDSKQKVVSTGYSNNFCNLRKHLTMQSSETSMKIPFSNLSSVASAPYFNY